MSSGAGEGLALHSCRHAPRGAGWSRLHRPAGTATSPMGKLIPAPAPEARLSFELRAVLRSASSAMAKTALPPLKPCHGRNLGKARLFRPSKMPRRPMAGVSKPWHFTGQSCHPMPLPSLAYPCFGRAFGWPLLPCFNQRNLAPVACRQACDLGSCRGRPPVKEVTPMLKRFLLDVLAGFLASVLAALVVHLMGF